MGKAELIAWASLRRDAMRRDIGNLIRHGSHAPRSRQLIWVATDALNEMLREPQRSAMALRKGEVVDGDWDLATCPIDTPKIRCSILHWNDGVPWDETGAYEHHLAQIEASGGSYDGCSTLDDIVRRYERLDIVFEQVRREGRLRTRREVSSRAFRESGGIVVHVGRGGTALWGRDGSHRLAMAMVLKLRTLPAQVGAVHADALDCWRSVQHDLSSRPTPLLGPGQ